MKASLQKELARRLRQRVPLPSGARVAVAVSGGADSVALLLLLHDLRDETGLVLRVLHFNHQLRGADADADETFVQELAVRLDLPCTVERADVRAIALREHWNLEDAARRLRYRFFERIVTEGLADHVATAHTADDQAETVLMHLLRGAGLAGLAGIHPVVGCVVRPLLETRRADLRAYLQSRAQPWREDATNEDTSRQRARIRHQLLPLLETDVQPAVVERLLSLATIARDESESWPAVLDGLLCGKLAESGDALSVHISDLQYPFQSGKTPEDVRWSGPGASLFAGPAAPLALQKKLLRRIIQQARGSLAGITAQHIAQVLDLCTHKSGGRETHLPGLVVSRDLRWQLHFRKPLPRTSPSAPSYQIGVDLPRSGATVALLPQAGLRLTFKLFDCAQQGRDTKIGADSLDRDLLNEPLALRNWRPGDSYRPRGRRSAHKLKRLFWEKHVPEAARAAWPVLLCGQAIVWAAQFGVAHEFAVTERTRTGVQMIEDHA